MSPKMLDAAQAELNLGSSLAITTALSPVRTMDDVAERDEFVLHSVSELIRELGELGDTACPEFQSCRIERDRILSERGVRSAERGTGKS